MGNMKIATTEEVKEINRTDGNRRLSDEGVGLLDPDGFHVLSAVMYHDDAGDNSIRCFAYFKFRDRREPEKMVFDVPAGIFTGLPEAESA